MTRLLVLLALLAAGMSSASAADAYPSRTITIIAPFAPGSGTDSVTRIITQRLAEILKVSIIVENRAGANGAIGATAAAQAKPDGYTLFIGGTTTHAANPSLLKSMQYDPAKDFQPIAKLGIFPYFLFVRSDLPVTNMKELVALAKAKDHPIAYANATGQLAAEMLKKRTGLDALIVPYKSSPLAVSDIVAGRVSMIFVDMAPAFAHMQAGKLRALATTTSARSSLYPDYPTMREAGFDLFDLAIWTGMLAPKNTPPEVVNRLSAALRQVLEEPETCKKLAPMGFECQWSSAEAFASLITKDIGVWGQLTKEAGIEAQ